MEAMRELAPETWSEYFDAVSKELLNAPVSIEITPGPATAEDQQLALRGLTYDGGGDVFEVAATQSSARPASVRRHLVDHPERVLVNSSTVLPPMTIAIDGPDGVRTMISFERSATLAD
jgi:hypothetical protein